VQDIQGKFVHEVVATADSCPRQHTVCTAPPDIVCVVPVAMCCTAHRPRMLRHPSGFVAGDHAHSGCRLQVSRYCVARPRPEPVSTAEVVPRLIPEQSVPSRGYAAVDYKLSVPPCVAPAVAGNALPHSGGSPRIWSVPGGSCAKAVHRSCPNA
jgi:hypothetical protein